MVKKRGIGKKAGTKNAFNDFSNKTVLIMLVLVIVVSVGSLAFYMASLSGFMSTSSQNSGIVEGKMTLGILKNPNIPEEIVIDKQISEVSIGIIQREE